VLLALLLACLAGSVAGHGLMIIPASRNYQSYKFDSWATKDYRANEATAGGEVAMCAFAAAAAAAAAAARTRP
jgi:predicted carbohydrate-binding protein with CBM5 and CBM33 domain